MDFSLSIGFLLLDFQEVIGLQQDKIDFLKDLKVSVNERLLACLTTNE